MSYRGIHLVAAVAKHQNESPVHLSCSPFFADVITDSLSQPVVHHWLVCREGSPEIIQWGQESTLEAAKTAAMSFIRELVQREQHIREA